MIQRLRYQAKVTVHMRVYVYYTIQKKPASNHWLVNRDQRDPC